MVKTKNVNHIILNTKNLETQRQQVTEKEIHEILHLLNNSSDLNLQIHVMSTLGVFLLAKNKYNDIIIKYGPLYDKIAHDLNRGLSLQTWVTLNFVSALLYIDVDEGPTRRKSLYLYAQNRVRTSGCLSAMCNLFMTYMMQQDTWSALCRCLAEACSGSAKNQTCCSHLVPLCIQRCQSGNTDVILVLQSLLQGHRRNNELFHLNNGMSIFTRALLQNPNILQLLNTIVENLTPDCNPNMLVTHPVFKELRELNRKPGCSSQIAQWSSIILYSREKGKYGVIIKDDDTQNKTISVNNLDVNNIRDSDDTEELFKNVIREVTNYHYYDNNNGNEQIEKKHESNKDFGNFQPKISSRVNSRNSRFLKPATSTKNQIKDLSFSFLIKETDSVLNKSSHSCLLNNTQHEYNKIINHTKEILSTNKIHDSRTSDTHYINQNGLHFDNENQMDFKPMFVSTPRHNTQSSLRNKRRDRNISEGNRSEWLRRRCRHKNLYKRSKICKPVLNMNETRNRSFSAKLLDVVNNSCTTIIKSVMNVFKTGSRDKTKEESFEKITFEATDSCSYSFTNYMRKRDQDLAKSYNSVRDITEKEYTLNVIKSCNTCNDTLELLEKMQSDKCLKETVKKLKQGINLFGCNFKKISKTFWPNEMYMTPNLLYNLYRKLIAK